MDYFHNLLIQQYQVALQNTKIGLFGNIVMLSRNAIHKGVNEKHPDFVLSSADTSIKVSVLPLAYAVYIWSEHCECALMQK